MNKIILTTSVLLVAVFTVAYLYFSSISEGSRNNDKALSLIPNDAALILEFKNDKSIHEIFSDYTVFDAIIGDQKKNEISALKSVLQNTAKLYNNSLGQSIFLSFHPQEADSIAFLWVMLLPETLSEKEATEALFKNDSITCKKSTIGNIPIIEARIKSLDRIFYLRLNQNNVTGSFSKKALQNSLDSKTSKIGPELIAEINRAILQNQNSPVTAFVNFKSSIPFLSGFFKNKLSGNFSLLNNFNAIATLNMNFKSDALMFNGITKTDTTQQNYINLFLNQKAVKNPIRRIAPDNTANYIAYGVSSYPVFHKDLQVLLKLRKDIDPLNETFAQIRNETGIDPDRDIKKYWGHEFITFQLSTQERFAGIQLTNGRQMQFFLEPLSLEYSENIRKLNYPGMLYYYFGDALKQFNKPYYTIIDNQMILSNSARSLQRYVNSYSRNPLYTDARFENFDQLVADHSNISIFIHIKNSRSNITSSLKRHYAGIFRSEEYGLKKFYGLSFQWTSEGEHFFTNFYSGYENKAAISDLDSVNDSLK